MDDTRAHEVGGQEPESLTTVVVAIAVNLAIALAKGIVAFLSGSAAMTAEAIHSLVDTANEAILLFGIRRSKLPANDRHPFGYGQELYFWTLVVAVCIFGIGGGMTIFEGIERTISPHRLENPMWSYVVLGTSFALESLSWIVSYRAVMRDGGGLSVLGAIRASKDPTIFTVLLEDSAALVGLAIAFVGTLLGHVLGNVYIDGIASIAIGAVLCVVAVFLVAESRGLLIGESAKPETIRAIHEIVSADRAVASIERALTVQLGPASVLLTIDLRFRHGLSGAETVAAIGRIERAIRTTLPEVTSIFIEASSIADAELHT
ncbi:MAG: cation diffusion facilitator family transporter [Vulcanimicrobiaceae bacterium]